MVTTSVGRPVALIQVFETKREQEMRGIAENMMKGPQRTLIHDVGFVLWYSKVLLLGLTSDPSRSDPFISGVAIATGIRGHWKARSEGSGL